MVTRVYRCDIIIKKIFWLPRWLGAFPYDEDLKPTRASIAWAVFALSFSTCISFGAHIYYGFYKIHVRRTLKTVSAALANFINLFVLLKNRDLVIGLREVLRRAEVEISTQKLPWEWNKGIFFMFKYQIVFTVVLIISVLVRLNTINFAALISQIMSYSGSFPILLSIMVQVTSFQDIFTSSFDVLIIADDARSFILAHNALLCASDFVHRIYGPQLFLFVTCTFTFVICNVYYEITGTYEVEIMIVHILWVLVFFTGLCDLIRSCNNTKFKVITLLLSMQYFIKYVKFPNSNR